MKFDVQARARRIPAKKFFIPLQLDTDSTLTNPYLLRVINLESNQTLRRALYAFARWARRALKLLMLKRKEKIF